MLDSKVRSNEMVTALCDIIKAMNVAVHGRQEIS